jgi:hypothetical protein
MFDDILQPKAAAAPPAAGGGLFDDIVKPRPPVKPAGLPAPPISGNYTNREGLRDVPGEPSVPISQPNIDTRGMKPAPTTEKEKQAARIQALAEHIRSGEKLPPGPLDTITDAASLGTSRPISAAITAGIAKARGNYPDASYGDTYQALIQYMNDRQARGDENTGPLAPLVRGVASMPAAMATGGGSGTVKAITQGTTAPARTVGGVATNPVTAGVRSSVPASTTEVAARAAVPGFIEGASQNAESLDSAVKGGTTSAAINAVGATVLDRGARLLPSSRRAAEAEATAARGRSPDEIRTTAKSSFDQLDNNGITYDARQTANLYQGLHRLRADSVYVPGGNAALDHLFDDLMGQSRQWMSFNELDNKRSAIAKLARSGDETTRVSARAINNEIDRLIGSGPPAINPNGVDVDTAYNHARRQWRQKALVEDAMFHADNVDRKIAINSDVNPNKAMKAEFGAVEKQYSKPGAFDPLAADPEGREMLSRIVRGGKAQNALAATGNALSNKYSTWAGGAAGLGVPKLFGASATANPEVYLPLAAFSGATVGGGINQAGKAFQRGAANLGQKDVDAYMRHLSGSPAPVPGAAIDRADLAEILFAQDLARLGAKGVSQYATGSSTMLPPVNVDERDRR